MLRKSYRITLKARIILLKLLLCSIGMFIGFAWKVYQENQKWNYLIYPNITVANIDIGGKTKNESIDLIYAKYMNPLINKKVNLIANNNIYVMEYSKLIESYDIETIIDNAFALGKDSDLAQKFFLQKKGIHKSFDVSIKYNNNYINELVKNIEEDINSEAVNASIMATTDGNIELIDDVKGYKLQVKKLEDYIKNINVLETDNDINIEFAISEIIAPVTSDNFSSIDTQIYSFNTSFSSSSPERINNIQLAVNSLDGILLMPDELFSFNECLGERTIERGYKLAPVIINGSFDNGIGGGICQVSSTLYNALLGSGISYFERRHHTLPTSYVGIGLDATVDWGNIDLKFKNTLGYPMLIQAYLKNNTIHINIYSNSSLTQKKYIMSNNIYKVVQPATRSITDINLPEGKLIVHQKGSTGYKVKVTRNTYENEVLINTELISDDYYEPTTRVIKIGSRNNK